MGELLLDYDLHGRIDGSNMLNVSVRKQ
jgi:hypothetical protein